LKLAGKMAGRFERSVRLAMEERPDQSVVIFTHGTVITLFVSRATGIAPYTLWERLALPSYIVLSWPALELLELLVRIN
jgi:broad specificity phosphatase PhoE